MAERRLDEFRPMDWRDRLHVRMLRFFRSLDPRDYTHYEEDEKSKIDKITDLINAEVAKHPDLPQEVLDATDPLPAILLTLFTIGGGTLGGMLLSQLFSPMFKPTTYATNRVMSPYRFDPGTISLLALRKWEEKPLGKEFWDDLKDQGWNEDRLNAAKELMNIIPPLADMVRFADFSAFDPEVIEKWREFYDAPDWILDPFTLLGITNEKPRDWANKYWFSHYVQPGRYELGEMFRRSEGWKIEDTPEARAKLEELGVTEDDLTLAYRTMAYSEFWQKRLLELTKAIPTRVDVRRWWDMRTIDEQELKAIYQRQGYFGKDLKNYVTWTKVYTDFPDLIARYKNGWIPLEEVKATLLADGMPPDRADELLETKFKKAAAPERVAAERDLTKTDITMAVKKELMTRGQGIEMLTGLGYDADEAGYIIDARVAAAGSPETPLEFRSLVESYRRSQGLGYKEIPQEVVEAERALLATSELLRVAYEREAPQAEIDELEVQKAEAQVKYRELLIGAGL